MSPRWRAPLFALVLLLSATALVWGSSLGRRDLWAPDEPKYALVAREMTETGEFLIPHVNGAVYPDKPPLMFWLIALTGLFTGGVGPVAAVIPSIVAGLFVLAATYQLSRRLAPAAAARTQLLSVGLLAISFRFTMQATSGQLDMLLLAFLLWGFLLLIEAAGLFGATPSAKRLAWAFVLMGIGTLAKGPIAVLLPVGALLLGAWAAGLSPPWRTAFSWRGWLWFLLPVGLWLLPAAVHAWSSGQGAWLGNILFKQTAVRYAASWHHKAPFWFFLTVPWYDFFPASLLLPAALAGLRWKGDGTHSVARRFLAGGCLFMLIFFSIPAGKRGLYLLPAYPLMAIWLALDLDWRAERKSGSLLTLRSMAFVLMLLSGVGAVVTGSWLPGRLLKEGVPFDTSWLALWLTAIALTSLLMLFSPRPTHLLPPIGALFAAFYVTLFIVAYPAIDQRNSAQRFIAEVRQHVVPEAQSGMVDFRAQFGFYAGRMLAADPGDDAAMDRLAAQLSGDNPFWLIVDLDRAKSIQRRLSRPACVALRRLVGSDELLVLANAAASRDPSHAPQVLPLGDSKENRK